MIKKIFFKESDLNSLIVKVKSQARKMQFYDSKIIYFIIYILNLLNIFLNTKYNIKSTFLNKNNLNKKYQCKFNI